MPVGSLQKTAGLNPRQLYGTVDELKRTIDFFHLLPHITIKGGTKKKIYPVE